MEHLYAAPLYRKGSPGRLDHIGLRRHHVTRLVDLGLADRDHVGRAVFTKTHLKALTCIIRIHNGNEFIVRDYDEVGQVTGLTLFIDSYGYPLKTLTAEPQAATVGDRQ